MKREQIKELAYMGMYLALYFVLDWLAHVIPFFQMPLGGSLGLGTIALLLCAYHLGVRDGIVVSLLTILISFMTSRIYLVQSNDGFSLWQIILQFMMEYPIAYGIYGLAPLFPNYKWFFSGIVITNLIRLALHTIAGTIYWATPWGASYSYNAWYMIPTMILGVVLIPVLANRLKKLGLEFKSNIPD